MHKLVILIIAVFIGFSSCKSNKQEAGEQTSADSLSITKENWGKAGDQDVDLYTLKNKNGVTIKIMNYGGIITEISTKDKNDSLANIVLGFDSIGPYTRTHPFFGVLVGRYANRIGAAKFKLRRKRI
ncbi:MAG: hypothetical protein HC822_26490 [Oscillochloris sp.]|nr:hypothetical protein [Oscillochloris sp.]